MKATRQSPVRIECLDDAIDISRHGVDDCGDGAALGERYARRDLCVHLHLGIGYPGEPHPRYLCAEFHAAPDGGEPLDAGTFDRFNAEPAGECCYYVRQTVFVAVGDPVEDGEWVPEPHAPSDPPCPSSVRLKALDSCRIHVAKEATIGVLLALPARLGTVEPSGMDREIDPPSLGSREGAANASGLGNRELVGEIVQGRPEVMDGVPYRDRGEREEVVNVWRDVGDSEHVVAAIRLVLADTTWAVGFDREVIPDLTIKFVSMLTRSIELPPKFWVGVGYVVGVIR